MTSVTLTRNPDSANLPALQRKVFGCGKAAVWNVFRNQTAKHCTATDNQHLPCSIPLNSAIDVSATCARLLCVSLAITRLRIGIRRAGLESAA